MARYRRVCHLVGLLLLICATTALKCPDREGTPGRELVCYTNTSTVDRLENAICLCTTLVYQGHDLQSLNASEIKSLRDSAKEANPDLRVVLSISDKHELLKNSATLKQAAVNNLTDILKEVDGVELNMRAGSKDRLVNFVKGLKDEMTNKSLEKMILLALPTKPEDLAKQFELKELSKYVDLFTVATHYLRDNDEAYRAFHPSRLMGLFDMLNTDSLVDLISGMGAPKHKILISAPASAYQFTLKRAGENTPRSPTVEEVPVALDRKKLCDAMSDGEWMVERDEDLTAPYAFKNTTWIAFEDETSLKIKGKYVILRELAGLGLRDVENDLKNDCGMSLAQSVHRAFAEMKRKTREVVLSSLEKDLKGTEITYPRHVRSSEFRIVRVVDTGGKIRAVRENTQTAFTCTRQGFFVHPKSCNRFYRCVKFNQAVDDYSVFEFDCPAGLAFDEKTEVCVWPGSLSRGSACPGSSEIEPVPRGRFHCPSHPGFYADPQNCRWFFACYDLGGPEMVPYEFRCPFGLVFDEHKLVCEWPWKVPNCNGPGHGDGHSVYNYGGGYGGQGGSIPLGGIIGQGGFIGQGGYAAQDFGGSYNNQGDQGIYGGGAHNGAGTGAGFGGQTFNAGGDFGAGAGYDGQTYNAGGAAGGAAVGAGYDGQTYNAGGATDGGVADGYDGQTYNAGGSAGTGAGFDGQTYNVGGAAGSAGVGTGTGYDGQTYNAGGTAGAGAGFDGQTYNAGGAAGSAGVGTGSGYDGQTYNAGGTAGAGAGYDGQTYNAGGTAGSGAGFDGQTYNAGGAAGSAGVGVGAGAGDDGQTYSAGGTAGASGAGAGYDGQTYNTGGADGTGAGYDGQTYNAGGADTAGAGYDGQTYNTGGATGTGAGVGYDGQTYNANGNGGAGFDGQTYNAGGAAGTGTGAGFDGQTYNAGGTAGTGIEYDGQTYNAAGAAGTGNDGQTYNAAGATGAGSGFDGQSYNVGGAAVTGTDYDGQTFNAGGNAGTGSGLDGQTFNAGATVSGVGIEYNGGSNVGTGIDYDGQNVNAGGASEGGGQVFNGPGPGVTNAADYSGQNFNDNGPVVGGDAGRGVGVTTNTFDGQNINTASIDSDRGSITGSADYDDRQGGIYAGGGGVYVPQYSTGGSATTVGVNNFAQDSQAPTGFTVGPANFGSGSVTGNGYAAGGTNAAGATTVYGAGANNGYTGTADTRYTAGVNNFAGDTDSARGVTSQNALVTGGRFGTNFADSTSSTGGRFNNGLSTISYADGQSNTGVYGSGNTQYAGAAGPTVYNASYSAGPGYPTSTIIPFVGRPNTFNTGDYQGISPVNSVIYHSNLAMGLSTTESFGNQYTNQAEKSFATQGRIPTGFAYNGGTQKTQNFNTATNVYDNSKVNLAGVTPSITLIRDGVQNAGGSTVGNSQTYTANFNGVDVTNDNENSNIIGSSISSANNDIMKFRGTTVSPDNFRFNGNTAGNVYQTDYNSGTSYNQGTTANQNAYVASAFAKTSTPNGVTPATIAQNFNVQGTPIPTVVPLNSDRPAVELDNSGIFGTNFAGSTTLSAGAKVVSTPSPRPQTSGYRTNEYYDNGGRGTIRYNNGLVTSKVSENDIPDYRTSPYTRIPNSFIINAGNGENPQSTIQKTETGTFTREGFTKTGPTKTGITTAQVGGSGSYVIGTGALRPKPNPQFIGANAFAGDFGTTGSASNFGNAGTATNFGSAGTATNFGSAGTATNFGSAGTATNYGNAGTAANFGSAGTTSNFGTAGGASNFGASGNTANFGVTGSAANFGTFPTYGGVTSTDFSKSNAASATSSDTAGYSYPKPLVQLEINGISSTPGVTQTNYISSTTPSSIPNIQSYTNQNSIIVETNAQNNKGFSTTISPIGFTTGQLENFKTTVYQAAKLPQTVSTVQPVIDTGSRTVISSTPLPAIISTQKQTYQDNFSTTPRTFLDFGASFDQGNDYISTAQGSIGSSDYSDITSNSEQGNFGQKLAGQTQFTGINYQQPTTNSKGANQNSELIKQGDYNFYAQTGTDTTAQTGSYRTNQATDFRNTVNIPKRIYIPSSTIAPAIGVTFSKPIVTAEFSGVQSSKAAISQNTADFASRGSANRILSNQASTQFIPPKSPSGILINQASSEFPPQGSGNGILTNQASTGFASEGFDDESVSNQASAEFGSRGFANGFFSNQEVGNFGSRGSANRILSNQGVLSNQGSGRFGTQESGNGVFGNQASVDFGSRVPSSQILNNQANSFSGQNQGFNGQTRTLVGSNVVTSIGGVDLNNDILRQNVGNQQNLRIVSEFNGAGNSNFGIQQSTTAAPEVTTYTGTFSRNQNRIQSSAAYNGRNQNRKVIVKLSDLHPLILGKLGAECTCKADPFAVFRGPSRERLPIHSQNRGFVDLANYDESDIYVDVDNDKDTQREIDFVKNIPSNRLLKTSNVRINDGLVNDRSVLVTSRGEPLSSTYLPSSSTYLPPTTARPTSTYLPPVTPSTYLPPATPSTVYLPSSTESQRIAPLLRENQASLGGRSSTTPPLLIRIDDEEVLNSNGGVFARATETRSRSGKALSDSSPNELRGKSEAFDRYGPGGLRSNDETLQGGFDCARPGLFRHPKFCNKFYACHWDNWKKRYTLHVFNCPVHLAFDASAGACNYPSKGPACQDNKLLI